MNNELFFIRHAESEANRQKILGSQLAYPLTPDGKGEADLIARELKTLHKIDRILSSPLLRARQTAASFGDIYDLKVEPDDRLKEQHFGVFSGMYYSEARGYKDFETDDGKRWEWVPRGDGESYRMIADRVADFFKDLEENPLPGKTLVVTHAVTYRLIEGFLQNTLPRFPEKFPNNGEIRRVTFKKGGQIHEIEPLLLGNSRHYTLNP